MGDEERDEEDWGPPQDRGSDDPGTGGGGGTEDISDTVAPSVGPHTTFDREPVEERLARHEQSEVDAMGLEKRRQVVGGRYGASFARQATLYGAAVAIAVAAVVGFILLAGELDKAPDAYEDQAPWSNVDAPQEPPSALQ